MHCQDFDKCSGTRSPSQLLVQLTVGVVTGVIGGHHVIARDGCSYVFSIQIGERLLKPGLAVADFLIFWAQGGKTNRNKGPGGPKGGGGTPPLFFFFFFFFFGVGVLKKTLLE